MGDTIFLLVCCVAMLNQLTLTVFALDGKAILWFHALFTLIFTYELYNTAMYYHTLQAAWTAFAIGVPFWWVPQHWWCRHVFHAQKKLLNGNSSNNMVSEALLTNDNQ